ncbi:techylectin-5A [Trichonephila clavipes]|nr:techylectin-5A [Trichonephila clavipes]
MEKELCYKMIKVSFLLCFTLFAISKALKNVSSGCNLGDRSIFYLDAATEMIEKAKEHFPECNDGIFALTNQRLYSIRFDLMAVGGEKRFAIYDTFWIDDENNDYTLHIKDYSGDAGTVLNLLFFKLSNKIFMDKLSKYCSVYRKD